MPRRESDPSIPHDLRAAAVGRVTPGIVHDANNALAVVVWNLERAARALPVEGNEAESAKTALRSTMKAASLLQRILEYAGRGAYDPDLVNLAETLPRLFATASAAIDGDVAIDCQAGEVGPVVMDETLFELGLLDLVATLSGAMTEGGSIGLTVADVPAGDAPPEMPGASILLALTCAGIAAARVSLQASLLRHFSDLAGGNLAIAADGDDGCRIRLYLPRAVTLSGDGKTFV